MVNKTRRDLIRAAAASGAVGAIIGSELARPVSLAAQDHSAHTGPPDGPLSSATVSFGAWPADSTAPIDRYPAVSPGARNVHLLIPNEPTIRAGGTVNFAIAGFHLVAIYDDGHQPEDIDASLVEPDTVFMSDSRRRIYRGLSLAVLAYVPAPGAAVNLGVRDRIEVVRFARPGRYLVICAFRPHFEDEMYGYVRVIP